MKMHELDITIRSDGHVSIHVEGAKGAGCDKYIQLFERLLNSEADIERTSEFYEPTDDISIHVDSQGHGGI